MKNNKDNSRRVVITGLGVVSSLGIGWQEFWKNLIAGQSGISKITSFDTSNYDRHYGGEVKNFKPEEFISKSKLKYLGRASQMAIAAAKLAVKDSKIPPRYFLNSKVGICLGTTMGEPQVMESLDNKYFPIKTALKIDNLSAISYSSNNIANNIALELKLRGYCLIFSSACASGNYAIARAYDFIRSGKLDSMLAGGADVLSRVAFTGFGRLLAMSPEKCRPFDKNRKGMLLGEGAGIVFMESLDMALKRKANIYAEIIGHGVSCDAKHMTEPRIEGICKSLLKSLKDAHLNSSDINYVCAHGTGTKENDEAESKAINLVFQDRHLPISSIKSMLGHTMGAAAAIETIACCLIVKTEKIPPTINYEEKDSDCDVMCVPNVSIKKNIRFVLNNSQAFGGNNSSIILGNFYE